MKLCVTMQKDPIYNIYTFKGPNDWRFYPLLKLISNDFQVNQLINWLDNDKELVESSEWIYIRKEKGVIALYDISSNMDETYCGNFTDPTKRFVMSVENFKEVVETWSKLQESKPDIVLLVIHEDDHVSLETDPTIIQEYQNAGYAFDAYKEQALITEFLFLQKKERFNSIDIIFSNVTSLLYMLPEILLELFTSKANISDEKDFLIITYHYFNTFIFYHKKENKMYIGSLGKMDEAVALQIMNPENILTKIDRSNSFALSYQDFMRIKKSWDEIQQVQWPYFMMNRDHNDIIFCKGFDTIDQMIDFVKESMPDKGKMVGDFDEI